MALNIPKLQYNLPMTLDTGVPTQTFQRWWQEVADNITSNFNDLAQAVSDIQTLQSQMNDRITEITTLQGQMNDRITEIENAVRDYSIGLGWMSPGSVLTSTDNGTDANIVIANHTRKYGNATSVSVTGATITGAYGTLYYVYYDDPSRAGGAVTYHTDTNPNVAANNAAVGRHYVGSITTTSSGGGSTSGGGTVPPGGDYSGPGAIP
jgi:hypothetical protein